MGIFNEHSSTTTDSNLPGIQGPCGQAGPPGQPGIGYKLTSNGNYDIENKKLVNIQEGTNNNDAVTSPCSK